MEDLGSWFLDTPSAAPSTRISTKLYECCFQLFSDVVQAQNLDTFFSRQLRAHSQKFSLSGAGFDAREGGLDNILDGAARLKSTLLPILCDLASVLLDLTDAFKTQEDLAKIRAHVRVLQTQVQLRETLNQSQQDGSYSGSPSDPLVAPGIPTPESSIQGAYDYEELVQDVQVYIESLYELVEMLENPAEKFGVKNRHMDQQSALTENTGDLERTPFTRKIEDEHPSMDPASRINDHQTGRQVKPTEDMLDARVAPFESKIMDEYPSIDPELAHRLGKANDLRYTRLKALRKPATKDSGDEPPSSPSFSHASASTSDPSQLSSLFDRQPNPPTSETTFASSKDGDGPAQQRHRGTPSMPKDQPWGEPSNCTVCGSRLSNVRSQADWVKHVYRDLRPYICSFADCQFGINSFVSRRQWAEHEFRDHRRRNRKEPDSISKQGFLDWISRLKGSDNITREGALKWISEQEVQEWISREECLFCRTCPASTKAQYVSHVGGHMQHVALAAIPPSAYYTDDQSNEDTEPGVNDEPSDQDQMIEGEYVPTQDHMTTPQKSHGPGEVAEKHESMSRSDQEQRLEKQHAEPRPTSQYSAVPETYRTTFYMVVLCPDDKIVVKNCILDNGSACDIIAEKSVKHLGKPMEQHVGGILETFGGSITPIGQLTLDWHVRNRTKTYTTTFSVVSEEHSGHFDVLLGKVSIGEIGFYKVDNTIW